MRERFRGEGGGRIGKGIWSDSDLCLDPYLRLCLKQYAIFVKVVFEHPIQCMAEFRDFAMFRNQMKEGLSLIFHSDQIPRNNTTITSYIGKCILQHLTLNPKRR